MTTERIPGYLRQHFYHLYAIALADLRIEPAELELLTAFGAQRGISRQELEDLLLSPAPFDPQIPPSPEARVGCLYDLARLAWADGVIQAEEQTLLCRLTELFGYEPEVSQQVTEVLLERARTEVTPTAVIGEVIGMAGPGGALS